MNKNTKRRHESNRAEIVARRKGGRGTSFQTVSPDKGMVQEVCHNVGPDGKRESITRYTRAPGAVRVYARTFKAAKNEL
jgi:hypothetical protein